MEPPGQLQIGLLIGFMLGIGIGMTIMMALTEGGLQKQRKEEHEAYEQTKKQR